eukprot:8582127-Pyramimonas_sp.AAC.1
MSPLIEAVLLNQALARSSVVKRDCKYSLKNVYRPCFLVKNATAQRRLPRVDRSARPPRAQHVSRRCK